MPACRKDARAGPSPRKEGARHSAPGTFFLEARCARLRRLSGTEPDASASDDGLMRPDNRCPLRVCRRLGWAYGWIIS